MVINHQQHCQRKWNCWQTAPNAEVCLQPPHDSWQRHYSVWLALTLEHEWVRACVCCLLIGTLSTLMGAVLGCEAVRSEAPAELSSAGAYNITMSWGPVLMAWGALTAIVPSRPTTPWTYTTPKLSPSVPPTSLLSLSTIQSASDSILSFWSGCAWLIAMGPRGLGDWRRRWMGEDMFS